MHDPTSVITDPVLLTPRPVEGELGGSNGRYEKHLADLKGLYADEAAFDALLANHDGSPVYWVEQSRTEERVGGLITGISVLEPGRVGDEFAMTRGHIHAQPQFSELYHCLAGHGVMLLETLDGRSKAVELRSGDAVYVPGYWVHRSVNVGKERFVTLFTYSSVAGQNYAVIGDAGGMAHRVVVSNHGWSLVKNSRHSGYLSRLGEASGGAQD